MNGRHFFDAMAFGAVVAAALYNLEQGRWVWFAVTVAWALLAFHRVRSNTLKS
jgi:hypothetical protein